MHNSYKKTIYGVRAALENMAQGVDESTKYHIPEDIPQNERTAFHGAAAAAAKSGKKSFNFGGKTHPVTMKKDTANAIADQKEEKVNEDPAHYAAIAKANDRKQAERDKADPEGAKKRKAGQAAIQKKFSKNPVKPADIGRHSGQAGGSFVGTREGTMNEEHSKTNKASMTIKHGYDEGDGPDNKKFAKYINKNTGATVKHHKDGSTMSFHGSDHQIHKALQHHHSDDKKGLGDLNYHKQGKTHSDDHVDGQHTYKAEGTTFREKLMSVLESDKASHYKGATKPEPMTKDDEKSGKKMKAGHPIKKDDHEETSTAAEKSTKPSKMRGNDNKQGDKNIMPSATKDTPANKTVKEKFDSLLKAYSVVQEYTHEFDVDHNHLKKVMSAAKKNGIKAKVHTMKGPGGGNPVVHLGHKDTDTMHKFVKKHYDPDYKKSDLNMHKL